MGVSDWLYYLRAMWEGDGRAMILHDAAMVGLFLAVLAFGVWFVRRTSRRDAARGFDPIISRETASRR